MPQRRKLVIVATETPPKRRRSTIGRPPHEPTEKSRTLVTILAGYALTQAQIAQVIGISVPTLALCYRDELANGAATIESKLIGNLLRIAGGSDGTALKAIMFSLQTRFGWSAYVPRPEEKPPAPLGKKEQARIEALTAHETSEDWGGILQ